MTLVTTGLTNGGSTTHYNFQCRVVPRLVRLPTRSGHSSGYLPLVTAVTG